MKWSEIVALGSGQRLMAGLCESGNGPSFLYNICVGNYSSKSILKWLLMDDAGTYSHYFKFIIHRRMHKWLS